MDRTGNATASDIFNDKLWLAVDQSTGQLYVTWTRFRDTADGGYLESPIVISTSTNGARTFTPLRRIDTAIGANNPGLQPFSQGSIPRVGPDGTLYVAYETTYCQTGACDRPTDRDVTVVATSTDHGASFSRSIVATNYDFPFMADIGTEGLTGENFRINSFPQLALDPVTGQQIVTWNDDRNGRYNSAGQSVRTNGDNIVSTSTDGVNWTRPVAIGSRQDEVFGAVASYGGVTAVTSYTRHYAPQDFRLDYAYWQLSTPEGRPASAGGLHRITSRSSNPRVQFVAVDGAGQLVQGVFIGDYSAVSMGSDQRLHPCWTDFRGNPGTTTPNQDAYTQSIQLR